MKRPALRKNAPVAAVEQAAGKAADISHAKHRAGHGHRQHGHGLDKSLCLELPLHHQIGDNHGKQRGNGRGDKGKHKRIPEGLQALVLGEHLFKPFKGEGSELVAPGGEQRPNGYAQVHHNHKKGSQPA